MIIRLNWTFFLLAVCFSFQQCKSQNKQDNKRNIKGLATSLSKEQQITYAVLLNAKTPYELYLDDILIDYSYTGNMNNTVELNPYLLSNGKHLLKIRFLPVTDNKEGVITPRDVIFDNDSGWKIYFTKLLKDKAETLGYSNSIDYKNSELEIQPPPNKVPFWEQQWELNVDALPYDLEGWKNGVDLSKLDSIKLENEVVNFYKDQWRLLNEGRTKEYLELSAKRDTEVAIVTYNDDTAWYSSPERVQNLERAKGHMLPLSNYKLVLYANGKLVALKIAEGKYKNWSALMSRSDNGRTSGWSILLYKPQHSDNFEIIRK